MGQFTMLVEATGAHHNFKSDEAGKLIAAEGGGYERTIDYDADLLFAEFVEKLKAKGHIVTHASFTAGSRETR